MLHDEHPASPPLRLSAAALGAFGDAVVVPTYDRSGLTPSIVHIGVGGFHRAHLATYVHELCAAGHTDWAIVGAGLLTTDATMADALASQDHLYTLIARDEHRTDVEVIGSIVDFVLAADDPSALVERLADERTQIVSLTITEGGYPVDDVTGAFVASRNTSDSVFDVVARGLDMRRRRHGLPMTILSCDNIMSNGVVARTATIGAAATFGADLLDWIDTHVSFPNSMVDRITPTTAPADIDWLASACGIVDRWPVVAETFRQWVVEDHFAGARLPLEELDVIVASDIEPYELTKLRLLNAGHSCLTYLAALDGHTFVDVAMSDPRLRRFVEGLLHREAKPTLPAAPGIEPDAYIAALIDRFANPAIGDQIARLCLDGSAKFPKFLLPTVRAQLADGGPVALSATALAGWCEYLLRGGVGGSISADPLLDTAIEFARRSIDEPAAFLDFSDVFGTDLASSSRFVAAFTRALSLLRREGVASAIDAALEETEARHEQFSD